jgi:LacI family transcriptional regulator
MALGIYQAANERGLQVPRDLSVIGFDDTPMARFLNPALTSVAQEKYEIGARAVQLVLEQIKQGRPSRRVVTLQPRLVVRQSCAPLPRVATQAEAGAVQAQDVPAFCSSDEASDAATSDG